MNQSLKRIIVLSVIYSLLLLLPAYLGILISFTGQPGGISQYNAFLAPFLGPWAQTLRPNPHPVSTWSTEYELFAKFLTAVLVLSVIGSYLAVKHWLMYPAAGMAVVALVIWVLAGLLKVISQLF